MTRWPRHSAPSERHAAAHEDRAVGRLIHFEGTYTNDFSGNPDKTARYNYNQVLYRLDLDNLVKAVLDALMPRILYDDSQVFRIDAEKHQVASRSYTQVTLMWHEEKK